MRFQASWRNVCAEGAKIAQKDDISVRMFFETHFVPYRTSTPEGVTQGLATGYYEPLLRGSRTRQPPYLSPPAPAPQIIMHDLFEAYPPEPPSLEEREEEQRQLAAQRAEAVSARRGWAGRWAGGWVAGWLIGGHRDW